MAYRPTAIAVGMANGSSCVVATVKPRLFDKKEHKGSSVVAARAYLDCSGHIRAYAVWRCKMDHPKHGEACPVSYYESRTDPKADAAHALSPRVFDLVAKPPKPQLCPVEVREKSNASFILYCFHHANSFIAVSPDDPPLVIDVCTVARANTEAPFLSLLPIVRSRGPANGRSRGSKGAGPGSTRAHRISLEINVRREEDAARSEEYEMHFRWTVRCPELDCTQSTVVTVPKLGKQDHSLAANPAQSHEEKKRIDSGSDQDHVPPVPSQLQHPAPEANPQRSRRAAVKDSRGQLHQAQMLPAPEPAARDDAKVPSQGMRYAPESEEVHSPAISVTAPLHTPYHVAVPHDYVVSSRPLETPSQAMPEMPLSNGHASTQLAPLWMSNYTMPFHGVPYGSVMGINVPLFPQSLAPAQPGAPRHFLFPPQPPPLGHGVGSGHHVHSGAFSAVAHPAAVWPGFEMGFPLLHTSPASVDDRFDSEPAVEYAPLPRVKLEEEGERKGAGNNGKRAFSVEGRAPSGFSRVVRARPAPPT